jgi:hypothetical protein
VSRTIASLKSGFDQRGHKVTDVEANMRISIRRISNPAHFNLSKKERKTVINDLPLWIFLT